MVKAIIFLSEYVQLFLKVVIPAGVPDLGYRDVLVLAILGTGHPLPAGMTHFFASVANKIL
ncbi:MAG: hypothetical protein ABL903_19920 [Methylococcales bacterium]